MLDQLALWLATYALHSTLLLGTAWLLARFFPAGSERLWRLALFGGLVTATLHAGGFWPRLAYLELPGLSRAARDASVSDTESAAIPARDHAIATAAPIAERGSALAGTRAASARVNPHKARAPRTADGHRREPGASTPINSPARAVTADRRAAIRPWPLLTIAWLIVLVASLATFAARAARFHWRFLAHRRTARGEAQRLLSDLARRAAFRRPVRLTLADSARVPMARGWVRPEICLPPALEDQLEPEELEAALAHELAHLERRDPQWRTLSRLVASALSFQPLNRLACRALEDEAELRCDDRAAALTGRPAALARCLTRVASWTTIDRRPTPLPALAANRGTLRRRVVRLLEGRPSGAAPRWTRVVAVIPPTVVLALAPGLGAAPPREDLLPAVTEASTTERPAERQARAETPSTSARAHQPPVVHRLAVPTFERVEPESLAVPPAPPAVIEREEDADGDDSIDRDSESDDRDEDDDANAEDLADEEELEAEAERIDAVADEVDRLMEDLDERIEAAVALVEGSFEQELEAVTEEIDGQVESFDDEIDRSLAPLEEALEELGDELEEAQANGNQARSEMLERQMGEIGAAMGDLGGRLGTLVSKSALTGVDEHLQTLMEAQSKTIARYATRQAEVGQRLAREIEERQRSGQRLDDEEIQAIEAELERIAEEATPHYEELERQVEDLTRQLEPTREQMRSLSAELDREVEAWRQRHAALLRELEEDGVTVPTYDDEPAAEPKSEPKPAPRTAPDAQSDPRPRQSRDDDSRSASDVVY